MACAHDFEVSDASGHPVSLGRYRGSLLLVVNVASQCGFTPQYAGLQQLHAEFHEKGLTVIGFPCNQFGKQEPGTNAEVQEFCAVNYGVQFPVMGKVKVNGVNAHPLYRWLTESAPGLLGTRPIKWNFTKFLVDGDGRVVKRYAPNTKPDELRVDIERRLVSWNTSSRGKSPRGPS